MNEIDEYEAYDRWVASLTTNEVPPLPIEEDETPSIIARTVNDNVSLFEPLNTDRSYSLFSE